MRRCPGRSGLLSPCHHYIVRIGKLYLSSGFLLLLSWLLYCDRSGIVLLGIIACILHEFGHLVTLFFFNSTIKEISITISGAKIKFNDHLSYIEELISAAAGPFVNLSLGWLISYFFSCPIFAGVNLALGCFNLLPVGPLDGARILYCLMSQFGNETLSYRLCRCVAFSFTSFFSCIGAVIAISGGNLTLLIMCFWLLFGTLREITANFDQKEWK